MRVESRDCVVLGGGPAGSTFAGILRKYAPSLSVTVLEKERFPRWRIGESTIPVANAVFRDLEVLEKLERSSFVKKMGITFVWGHRYVRIHARAPDPMLGKLWREIDARRRARERQADPTDVAPWHPPSAADRRANDGPTDGLRGGEPETR